MREIKFRVPMKCQNGHFRWFYYTIKRGEVNSQFGSRNCNCLTGDFDEGYSPCGDDEQFAGLKDKNDREIYEGDIVVDYPDNLYLYHSHSKPYEIKWDINCFNAKRMSWLSEVIGNIYENPKLLEDNHG